MNLQNVDYDNLIATGILHWYGTDNYWSYTLVPGPNRPNDSIYTNPSPHLFGVDQNIPFTANLSLQNQGCRFGIHIYEGPFVGYGPYFAADFSLSGEFVGNGLGFTTHPTNPINGEQSVSSGLLFGHKQ